MTPYLVSDEEKESLNKELKKAFASVEGHNIKVNHVELFGDDPEKQLVDLKKWKPKR